MNYLVNLVLKLGLKICHKFYKFCLRFRNYIESKIGYLEIKLKSNKDRTIKTRIKSKLEDSLTETQKIFIESNSNLNPELLIPKVWINYKRICEER